MKYGFILSAAGNTPDPLTPVEILSHGSIGGELRNKKGAAFCTGILEFNGNRTPPLTMMFDTGSSISVVDSSAVKSLTVPPLPEDYGTVFSATDQVSAIPVYSAKLSIGNMKIDNVQLWELDIASRGTHVIIGTDILKYGKLVYDGINGTFLFEI